MGSRLRMAVSWSRVSWFDVDAQDCQCDGSVGYMAVGGGGWGRGEESGGMYSSVWLVTAGGVS